MSVAFLSGSDVDREDDGAKEEEEEEEESRRKVERLLDELPSTKDFSLASSSYGAYTNFIEQEIHQFVACCEMTRRELVAAEQSLVGEQKAMAPPFFDRVVHRAGGHGYHSRGFTFTSWVKKLAAAQQQEQFEIQYWGLWICRA